MADDNTTPSSGGSLRLLIEEWRRTMRLENATARHATTGTRERELLQTSADTLETCANELAALAGHVPMAWQPIEQAPIDGTPFRAYGPALIHPDFNPLGQVEAVYEDGRLFGAIWDGQFDCWNSVDISGKATHCQPFPPSPTAALVSALPDEGPTPTP